MRAEVKISGFKFLFNFTPFFGKMWFIFNSIGTLLYQKCVFRMSEIPCTRLLCLSLLLLQSSPYIHAHPHTRPYKGTYFFQSPPVKKFIVISWVAYKSVKSHLNSLAFMWGWLKSSCQRITIRARVGRHINVRWCLSTRLRPCLHIKVPGLKRKKWRVNSIPMGWESTDKNQSNEVFHFHLKSLNVLLTQLMNSNIICWIVLFKIFLASEHAHATGWSVN